MELIHCMRSISDKFDLNKINPILNLDDKDWVNKPYGGLWTSPLESNWGWKDFIESIGYCKESYLNNFICIELFEDTKIIKVDKTLDLLNLPFVQKRINTDISEFYTDFEELVKRGYQALHLTENGLNKTKHSTPINFFGWDVETVLILDKSCIKHYY